MISKKNEDVEHEASIMRAEFASLVSHELRTPLTVISGGVSLMLDEVTGKINDKQRRVLDVIKQGAERMVQLITDILDLQKMELGQTKYNIQENNMSAVVSEVCEGMTMLAKATDIELLPHIDENLPRVAFDRVRIVQVLTHLIHNALNSTEKGTISVTAQHDGDAVHVTVKHAGPGIAKKDISKFFQAFVQVGTVGKRKRGTGLGLAISKQIILSHNGKIWVESEPGKGTAIHFTLSA